MRTPNDLVDDLATRIASWPRWAAWATWWALVVLFVASLLPLFGVDLP